MCRRLENEVYDLIITAQNFNSYYLRWCFVSDNVEVLRGYYRYPNFNHESKISVEIGKQSYFAINAFHSVEKRSLILLYNITDVLNTTANSSIGFEYKHFVDYTPFREDNPSSAAFVVVSNSTSSSSKGSSWIWASAPTKAYDLGNLDKEILKASYCVYGINDYVQIVVQSGEIHSTSLYLNVGNDIGKDSIEFLVTNSVLNPKARMWFIILVAILFVTGILMFACVKLCYPKPIDNSDDLLYGP